MKFHKLIGLSGVAAHESAAAIRWGKRFEWPMLLVASWIFVQWYLEAAGELRPRFLRLSDWVVWLFFLLETVVLVSLVRIRYVNRSPEPGEQVADRRGWAASRATRDKIRARAVPFGTSHAPLRRGEAGSGAIRERFR